MHQVKLLIQLHQRFRGSEKEVAAKIKVAEKVVDDLRFRSAIKIDENVAAENQIHAFHEKHLGIILQIQTAERNHFFHLWSHLQLLLSDRREIIALEKIRSRAKRIIAKKTSLIDL